MRHKETWRGARTWIGRQMWLLAQEKERRFLFILTLFPLQQNLLSILAYQLFSETRATHHLKNERHKEVSENPQKLPLIE